MNRSTACSHGGSSRQCQRPWERRRMMRPVCPDGAYLPRLPTRVSSAWGILPLDPLGKVHPRASLRGSSCVCVGVYSSARGRSVLLIPRPFLHTTCKGAPLPNFYKGLVQAGGPLMEGSLKSSHTSLCVFKVSGNRPEFNRQLHAKVFALSGAAFPMTTSPLKHFTAEDCVEHPPHGWPMRVTDFPQKKRT